MFNSLGSTPSPPRHHPPTAAPLAPMSAFTGSTKAPTSPKSPPPLAHFESKSTDFTAPTLAAVKPPRFELPTVTQSAENQVQRITRLYPPSSKKETRLNLNYPTYPTPIHCAGITRQTSGSSDPTYQALTLFSPRAFSAATFCSKAARPEK